MSVNWRDLVGGVALLVIGGFFVMRAGQLGIGTPRNMGAGYFPMLGGVFTMICAGFVVVAAFAQSDVRIERPALRPFLAVMAGIGAFILVMPRAGLVPAVIVTALVASLAEPKVRPVPTLALAVFLGVGCYLVFVAGLGLPIRPWRNPF